MQDYRVETTVERDGSVTIKGVPYQAGDQVEVIVRSQKAGERNCKRSTLRGKPFRYTNPFDGVSAQDWGVLP